MGLYKMSCYSKMHVYSVIQLTCDLDDDVIRSSRSIFLSFLLIWDIIIGIIDYKLLADLILIKYLILNTGHRFNWLFHSKDDLLTSSVKSHLYWIALYINSIYVEQTIIFIFIKGEGHNWKQEIFPRNIYCKAFDINNIKKKRDQCK